MGLGPGVHQGPHGGGGRASPVQEMAKLGMQQILQMESGRDDYETEINIMLMLHNNVKR